LIKPVASVAPPHPKIITITYQITVGHPLVRELHGEWVGTSSAQIMAASAIQRERFGGLDPATKAKLDQIIAGDRHRLLADIVRGRPDLILTDDRLFDDTHFDWWAWANADPQLARVLSGYHKVGVVRHRIIVWKRNLTLAGGERMRFEPDDVSSLDP
ncbi:MAG TPA: hypothetical protein VG166_04805, partial [Caulobacteraceae bacterium]|nr:hypothetical protein [Caulobacteraceae bacterium]